MKKLLTLLFGLMLVFSLAMPSFAQGGATEPPAHARAHGKAKKKNKKHHLVPKLKHKKKKLHGL